MKRKGVSIQRRSEAEKFSMILPAVSLLLLLLACCNRAGKLPFSFVQLCDPQLGMGGYAHDTATLRQAVRQINALDCDFVVVCGDLVHHASDSSFQDLLEITGELCMPCYFVAGNHDVGNIPDDTTLAYFRQTIGRDYYTFAYGGYRLVVTNSQLWKTHIGKESEWHDQWFREVLSQPSRKRSPVIVIGHYPLYVGQVDEEEAYFNLPPVKRKELLDLFIESGVVAYLSGHRHETLIKNYQGIQLVTGESTSRNFDDRPLGFRLWNVAKDTLMHSFIPLHTEEESALPD